MRLYSALIGAVLLYCPSAMAAPHGDKPSGQSPQFFNSASHKAADPYVLYDSTSGQYYAYSTEGADEGYNFAIYSSPDLATWHKHPGGVLKACYRGEDDAEPLGGGQACWARDWFWAPEAYHNEKTGWYFFFFAGRLREDLTKDYFRYSKFEEPSKIGVAVSRSPTGPFKEIEPKPIDYYPFDPDYPDVNLIMDEEQMLPPQTLEEGQTAPKGTYIPTIDVNLFFDNDGRIYMYLSRNAYRNWNWDADLGKYIEESNIIVVELERDWWDNPDASTMPKVPCNITMYNGVGELGHPPRKDGWKTVISYGADPQEWENFHVDDYAKFNGTKKDRRWSEGSTVITRPGPDGRPVYLLTYSANNYEAANYGVGFATAESPLGPFRKSANNPVLSQLTNTTVPIYSTGHGSIVASPPRPGGKGGGEKVGAQDVMVRTPEGAELFYVHHARDSTDNDRSIYTTRMTLDESAVRFGSDDAISMHLTPFDQPLPKWTYPIELEAKCSGDSSSARHFSVRVTSLPGALFDITEHSNRVVAFPGDREATAVGEDDERQGSVVLKFDDGAGAIKGLAYQRLGVDGGWSTIVSKHVYCR